MWLYICTCLVALSVTESDQLYSVPIINKPRNDVPKQADVIFSDVIKNISRVNHVLQELINNYEQLQKIYKSQENVESEYSDSEIDEIFKSKKGKQSERSNIGDETTKNPYSSKLATQMFWSDHEEDDDNVDSDADDTKEKNITNNENVKKTDTTGSKQDLPSTRKTTTLKPENLESSDESSDTSVFQEKVKSHKKEAPKKSEQNFAKAKQQAETSEESDDESSDMSVFQKKIKKHKKGAANEPDQMKIVQNFAKVKPQAEVIFIDTHKKPKELLKTHIKSKEVEPKIEPAIVSKSTKPKTRYSKVSHNSHNKLIKTESYAPNEPKVSANETRKVKKITYSESFSPQKIWNDIINNKPIKLETHSELTMRRIEKPKANGTGNVKRSQNGKSAVVLIAKHKKKGNENVPSSEDETHKEELKINGLRQAYGDACLKLVVRKCHKACKAALKKTCIEVKCKSEVKSSFKSYARTGCIKEFHGIQNYNLSNNDQRQTIQKPSATPETNYRGKDGTFVDMTREGFLSAACLPHVEDHKEKALRNDTPAFKANPVENLNILRDRFERACKKISSKKCRKACNYAYTTMCESKKCSNRMTKRFKKSCKKECKEVYDLNTSSSESDRDSDSDDDSDRSDSGSD